MSQKQVMPKSENQSRSLEINAMWTFDTEFPTIFNKSCTYIIFKSAVKHRQLGYGYPQGQTVHLAEATNQDTFMHGEFCYNVAVVCTSFDSHAVYTFEAYFGYHFFCHL